MNEDNVIKLPGSEGWENAYAIAKEWVAKFPGQDADELAICMEYNAHLLNEGDCITKIQMLEQGEKDEQDWMWCVWTDRVISYCSKATYIVVAGCDYTGWDCQSSAIWTLINR